MAVPLLIIAPVCDTILLNVLLPHLAAVRIDELSDEDGVVRIRAHADSDEATCPACGNTSGRVHCWYERQLADAPQGATTPPTPTPSPPIGPPPPPTTYTEQEGHNGVNTFTNPHNASGLGPKIAPGQYVQVTCKLYDPTIASVKPDGYWYRITSAPWNGQYYSPANTFMNGDPWNGPYTHNTDWNVPNC